MKKIAALALGLVMALQTQAQEWKKLALGSGYTTADKEMVDVMGDKKISLRSLQGANGLLVMFTCNTCPFVIKNQQRTAEVLRFAAANKVGVALLNPNEAQREDVDSEEAMLAYGKDQNYPNYLVDDHHTLADYFGAGHTPEVFFFDASGNLVYRGAMDDNPADPASAKQLFLQEAITQSIAGKPIIHHTTKSLGCSIKRIKK